MSRRLVWRVYIPFLLMALSVLAAFSVYMTFAIKRIYLDGVRDDLAVRARLAARELPADGTVLNSQAIDGFCKKWGNVSGTRFTVILPDGRVAGDSVEKSAAMDNHSQRPEIIAALRGDTGEATRFSSTLRKKFMYVAVPLQRNGHLVAVVRASVPVDTVTLTLRMFRHQTIIGLILAAILFALVGIFVSRHITEPIEAIRDAARRIARGDLQARAPVSGTVEMDALASTLNQMAGQLQDRMDRMSRLERVRRDFVANVSHELKTPLTAIRGCIETIAEDECLRSGPNRRFLDMLERQTNRLQSIVEDLLSLSALEHSDDHAAVEECVPAPVGAVVERVIALHADDARRRGMQIVSRIDEDVIVPITPHFMEQAVGNLIDNAIKYAGPKGRIDITLRVVDGFCEIVVSDEGPGIEPRHLPHIFQRFYRVDKARSRESGGTGLGLAIVKHVALAHGGSATVESSPGEGATFIIRIPLNGNKNEQADYN
jgi:signal transduction histidine kinase